jgi:hypothetical protein
LSGFTVKEKVMNKADMLIFVHPELDEQKRTDLEMMIERIRGQV